MNNYFLLAYPRSASTYTRFIISYLLKTYAKQPIHNNDPTFKSWPKDLSNDKKNNFVKFHFVDQLLLNKTKDFKLISIIRSPIDSIKAFCIYDKNISEDISNSYKWNKYWENIYYLDNLDNVLLLSFKNITNNNDEIHLKEIKKLCKFLNIDYNTSNYNTHTKFND